MSIPRLETHLSQVQIIEPTPDIPSPSTSQEWEKRWTTLQPVTRFSLPRLFSPLQQDGQQEVKPEEPDPVPMMVALSGDDARARSRAAQALINMKPLLNPDDADAVTASLMATIKTETTSTALMLKAKALLTFAPERALRIMQDILTQLQGYPDEGGRRATVYEFLATCGEKGIRLIIEDFKQYYDFYNIDGSYSYEAWDKDEQRLMVTLLYISDQLGDEVNTIANIMADKGLPIGDIIAAQNNIKLQARLEIIAELNVSLQGTAREKVARCYEQQKDFYLSRQAQKVLEKQVTFLASNTILSKNP